MEWSAWVDHGHWRDQGQPHQSVTLNRSDAGSCSGHQIQVLSVHQWTSQNWYESVRGRVLCAVPVFAGQHESQNCAEARPLRSLLRLEPQSHSHQHDEFCYPESAFAYWLDELTSWTRKAQSVVARSGARALSRLSMKKTRLSDCRRWLA